MQSLWLAIQVGFRVTTKRQSSQLEISALAFAVCAFITYLFLIPQPKDIATPTIINAAANKTLTAEEFAKVAEASKADAFFKRDKYTAPSFLWTEELGVTALMLGTSLSLTVFGSIYLIA